MQIESRKERSREEITMGITDYDLVTRWISTSNISDAEEQMAIREELATYTWKVEQELNTLLGKREYELSHPYFDIRSLMRIIRPKTSTFSK